MALNIFFFKMKIALFDSQPQKWRIFLCLDSLN